MKNSDGNAICAIIRPSLTLRKDCTADVVRISLKAHPGKRIEVQGIAFAAPLMIPMKDRAWTCAKCGLVIPWAPVRKFSGVGTRA